MMQQWIAVHRTATERHHVLLKHSPEIVDPVSGVLRCLVTVKIFTQFNEVGIKTRSLYSTVSAITVLELFFSAALSI